MKRTDPPETPDLDPRDRDLWVSGWMFGYQRGCQDTHTEQLELELNDGD